MAKHIAKGITEADSKVNVKLFNSSKTDKNDVIAEIFKSKAVLFGSPAINKGILTSVAGLLEEICGLSFKNKKAASFGCYVWSGESVQTLNKSLEQAGFTVVEDGLKALWIPTAERRQQCVEYGRRLANVLG
jgi:flavorubredoxin